MSAPKDLLEFLTEAELQQYYQAFTKTLKIQHVGQIKYVDEEDLQDVGMSKPEMRRLKKFFRKECPQGAIGKLKKILQSKDVPGAPASPPANSSSPDSRASSVPRSPSKQVISEDAITILKSLGSGEFGTVSQGLWTNDDGERVQVAIKTLSREKMPSDSGEFLKEAAVMQQVDCEHIVTLYGVVLSQDAVRMVTELAPLRSLLECLKEPALRASFPVSTLCDFASQIANGMAYLESKRLIHRDLAARNILVFSKEQVKISDFGLSRALGAGKDYYQTNFSANLKLPLAWLSPEAINYLKFTSASDVWAFGVTLWEMFSYGFRPWAALTGEQDEQNGEAENSGSDWRSAEKILEAIDEPNHQRLEQPEWCPREHYALMLKCWEHEPERRPKFSELQLMLPQLKPERVQTQCECVASRKDVLSYKANEVITVLDKRPESPPEEGMWKGISEAGRVGFFSSKHVTPYVEVKTGPSPAMRRLKINRKESSRKSSRTSKRLDPSMIGNPEKDLRHVGHIGYDGAMFGDVSIIGGNYDKLPIKVSSPAKVNGSMSQSMTAAEPDRLEVKPGSEVNHSHSDLSLSVTHKSSLSVSSHLTDDTLTDVSSVPGGAGSQNSLSTMGDSMYEGAGAGDELDSFKLPDISSDFGFDFGSSSLMDDIMKSLSTMGSNEKSNETLVDDKSPLLEKSPPFQNGRSSFDNFAMATDQQNDNVEPQPSECLDQRTSYDFEHAEAEGEKEEDGRKRQRPNLRINIPGRHSSGDSSAAGVKPLSASEERKIDEAIRLANDFATGQMSPQSNVGSPGLGSDPAAAEESSPKGMMGVLSAAVKRREKSPTKSPTTSTIEKRSFTEEIASVGDVGEELSPEAEEAYNLLVVKGSVKENSSSASAGGSRKDKVLRVNGGRNNNANIRAPIIPGRRVVTEVEEDVSVNPLRRLRESQVVPPRPAPRPAVGSSRGGETIRQNTPFFDKLKELEQDEEQGRVKRVGPEPPPRNPLKTSTLNQKPRERKHPLDLSTHKKAKAGDSTTTGDGKSFISGPILLHNSNVAKSLSSELNNSRDSEDSAFNTESDASSGASGGGYRGYSRGRPKSGDSLGSYGHGVSPSTSKLSIKGVKWTASELGLNNSHDNFWNQDVDFSKHQPIINQTDLNQSGGSSPGILGRYISSGDTVSYEDLLDLALDGEDEISHNNRLERGSGDGDLSEEVQLMKRLLPEVSLEDCMYSLEDTNWDVNNAIKLVKLKQLLSLNVVDTDACKETLIQHNWDTDAAAKQLVPDDAKQEAVRNDSGFGYRSSFGREQPKRYSGRDYSGRDSPELVHV